MITDRPKNRWRFIRAATHGVTLLLIAAIMCSIWLPQSLVLDHTNAPGNQRVIIIQLHDCRIGAEQSPMLPPTGTTGLILQRIGAPITNTRNPWWAPPSYQYFPTPAPPGMSPGIAAWYIELPLIYPTLLLVLISLLIIRRRRKTFGPGQCPRCGYDLEGIESQLCPECGIEPKA